MMNPLRFLLRQNRWQQETQSGLLPAMGLVRTVVFADLLRFIAAWLKIEPVAAESWWETFVSSSLRLFSIVIRWRRDESRLYKSFRQS